ncbi:HIT domain-containing protein [Pleurostoma richardsiae]|uniref:Bis(5'-adenosyl)-triphosphatase n=1 Tax=Pleurostoma richardsiae TaxID=41990 RepID=A0AA38R8J2_9PEZI|nr:HIT domain-containing protein [Pleurostoma richardsiae]
MSSSPAGKIFFGPFEVTTQVFLQTTHSFALVNLKPLLPGHVLVCPSRPHRRLTDLTAPELTDLWQAVQRVQRMLARQYFTPASSPSSPSPASASSTSLAAAAAEAGGGTAAAAAAPPAGVDAGSFNIALQDGPEAGQTVSHVHVHVIPRIRGATAKPADTAGDELYEQMTDERGNVGGALWDAAAAARRREEEDAEAEGGGGRPRPGGRFPRIEDCDRKARSMEEMEAEAEMFKGVLREMDAEEAAGR